MTFIRFLFILALAVPLVVFMLYLLNKLTDEFNESQKKLKEDKLKNSGESRDRQRAGTGTGNDRVYNDRVYNERVSREKVTGGKISHRSDTSRLYSSSYIKERTYESRKEEMSEPASHTVKNHEKMSKRKRRKERKIKKKDRER